MQDRPLRDIMERSPIGMAIYQPVFNGDELVDLTLSWFNQAVIKLTGIPRHAVGRPLSAIAPDALRELHTRFAIAIADESSFSYTRHWQGQNGAFDFRATAWYVKPYIAIVMRETTHEESEQGEVEIMLRMLDDRISKTQALADLLGSMHGEHVVRPINL